MPTFTIEKPFKPTYGTGSYLLDAAKNSGDVEVKQKASALLGKLSSPGLPLPGTEGDLIQLIRACGNDIAALTNEAKLLAQIDARTPSPTLKQLLQRVEEMLDDLKP